MRKFFVVSLCLAVLAVASPASAQTATTTDAVQQQIQALLQQIQQLQAQIQSLLQQQGEIRGEIRALLKIERPLARGSSGEDVRALQEALATDRHVYPEGIVSGFYGPLTEQAVKRFQARFGMEQVGTVGPQTRTHINYMLEHGAGNSGVIPHGLLTKFKGQSIFENLPEAVKARCKKRAQILAEKIPSLAEKIPFGIFAQCDDVALPPADPDEEEEEEEGESPQSIVVALSEQNESGLTGTARLTDRDGSTLVRINLTGAPEGIAQPAHIHANSCADIGEILYPLEFPVNGVSVTTLDVSLDAILAQLPLSLNVHKSVEEISVYVACGDLTQ